jgi:hypothetical protein
MVKDHRTGFQTADPEGVLDGDLGSLIKAYFGTRTGEER